MPQVIDVASDSQHLNGRARFSLLTLGKVASIRRSRYTMAEIIQPLARGEETFQPVFVERPDFRFRQTSFPAP